MAAGSSRERKEDLAESFKRRLQDLDCPYIDGVDESWVNELLFKPGEARIRLLQWLFARYDSKLNDLLEGPGSISGAKMDSRLQTLLQISSMMGLCKPDDIDLVRGASSTTKQAAFWDKLLDIICIADRCDDHYRGRSFASPGGISAHVPLGEKFKTSCDTMTNLVHQREFQDSFASKITLLPPDILRTLDNQLKEEGYKAGQRPAPDPKQLIEYAEKVTLDLQAANTRLEEIKNRCDYPKYDPQAVANVSHTLKLVLSEMAQLITSFSYCFENEIRQWCNKTPPRLTQLGPAFKRVDGQLQQFNMLIQGLQTIRSSYTKVSSKAHMSLDEDTLTEDSIGEISQATLTTFQECMSVLNESKQRNNQTWTGSNSLNTTGTSFLR